ncbi:hypothetical protein LOAG_18353 [Loa loa]|uniref:Uncharacterized protein n=1 Tax=Loa loa TaxID=7209 RepID=A0A1S0UF61_LOALO|nr:hypothetical protein LOAG_18353 [Loa loa]EJD74312.1 hypothetical protein LOAG_18353 [Loa loa]
MDQCVFFLAPAYSRRHWEQLADLLLEVQNRTQIKFRSFIKERDTDYVSVKITTYGCYGLLGYGKGGERWINLYDECIEYSHIVLRSIYQILGFQMIAMKKPERNILYSGSDSKIDYLKFVIWNKLIVDSKKIKKQTDEDECIGAETATSMMSHQPNMEFIVARVTKVGHQSPLMPAKSNPASNLQVAHLHLSSIPGNERVLS